MDTFSLIAIRILPGCSEDIRKVLKENEWYFFNQKYIEKDGNLVLNELYSVPIDFYSNKINIQAIVGKNGSGKSSVIEIMLRLVNNLVFFLIAKANTDTELHFVSDVYAELFFEIGGIMNSLRCLNNKIYLDQGNGYISVGDYLDVQDDLFHNTIGQNISLKTALPLLKKFFFTIVNNYSFHAYNANDFFDEFDDKKHVWIDGLFHKNDGYLTPLVLNPFRDFGKIDAEREKNLTNIRLASLFHIFKKEGIDFIPGYSNDYLNFKLDSSHVRNKYLKKIKVGSSMQLRGIEISIGNKKGDVFNTTLKCYFGKIIEDERLDQAYKYLVYKTFSISEKYPNYHEYFKSDPFKFKSNCPEKNKIEIQKLVDKIKSDPSHTTLKIKQTLKFIDYVISFIKGQRPEDYDFQYFEKFEETYIDYRPNDTSIFNGLTELDNIIANFPPPFYKIKIGLISSINKPVTFEKMSSGERQFLFYMSTLLYHLKNLDSVVDGNESVNYKYINIFLEEVELYFHPEYQRQFVSKLINYITACHFNNIEYFNIIIATHSPFILSDIPKDNIMFLDNGKQVNAEVDLATFGGNIHELLAHGFFMETTTGEYAISKINEIIKFHQEVKMANSSQKVGLVIKYNQKKEEYNFIIKNIGEDVISGILQNHIKFIKENLTEKNNRHNEL